MTLAAIEAERRGRSDSVQTKPPRSLQAEMECEESGSSLGESEDLRGEVARAMKRLNELCVHLRRGEDDSGLQSDCDESMLVIVNNTAETENVNAANNGQETPPSTVNASSSCFCSTISGFLRRSTSSAHETSKNVLDPPIGASRSLIADGA